MQPSPKRSATTAPTDTEQTYVLLRFVGTVLAVYWLTLFAATHMPLSDAPVGFRGADKIVHFAGYGILGLLVGLWVALRRPLTIKIALLSVAVLAAYGAIDELLQIPVGRTCDIYDWTCDVFGAGAGMLVMWLAALAHPREEQPRLSPECSVTVKS